MGLLGSAKHCNLEGFQGPGCGIVDVGDVKSVTGFPTTGSMDLTWVCRCSVHHVLLHIMLYPVLTHLQYHAEKPQITSYIQSPLSLSALSISPFHAVSLHTGHTGRNPSRSLRSLFKARPAVGEFAPTPPFRCKSLASHGSESYWLPAKALPRCLKVLNLWVVRIKRGTLNKLWLSVVSMSWLLQISCIYSRVISVKGTRAIRLQGSL